MTVDPVEMTVDPVEMTVDPVEMTVVKGFKEGGRDVF